MGDSGLPTQRYVGKKRSRDEDNDVDVYFKGTCFRQWRASSRDDSVVGIDGKVVVVTMEPWNVMESKVSAVNVK
jgi:hypothetical protein